MSQHGRVVSLQALLVVGMDPDCYHSSIEAFEVRSVHSQDDRLNLHFMPFRQKNWAERSVLPHCGLVLVIKLIPSTYQTSTIVIFSGPIMSLDRAPYLLALRSLLPLLPSRRRGKRQEDSFNRELRTAMISSDLDRNSAS